MGAVDADNRAAVESCDGLMPPAITIHTVTTDTSLSQQPMRRAGVGVPRHRLERLRPLLADDVSPERAWHELPPRVAAVSTVEALMYSLRRGVDELTKPDTLRRISELESGQLKAVCRRLQNFNSEIAIPWSSDEVTALIERWRELHG